jgi:uncharacterized protein (TIGR02099 family)
MSRLSTQIIRRFEYWLWLVFFLCTILFMVSWSFTQILLWGYDHYSKEWEQMIEEQSGFDIRFNNSYSQMLGVNPLISVTDFSISQPGMEQNIVSVNRLMVELNTLKSLWYLRPVLDQVVVDGLSLSVRETEDHKWLLNGLKLDHDVSNETSLEVNRWVDILFYQGNVDVREAELTIIPWQDEPKSAMVDLLMSKSGDETRMTGEVQGIRNPVALSFQGESFGLPGEPEFNLDMHLEVSELDSADWMQEFSLSSVYKVDRAIAIAESWLNWNREGVTLITSIDVEELSLLKKDDGQKATLKTEDLLFRLSFKEEHCDLYLPETSWTLNNAERLMPANRAVCDHNGNWWWTTPTIDLNTLVQMSSWLPERQKELKDDLSILDPVGTLSYPTLWISDSGEFRFEAELQSVSVNAWYGAPGLKNINGRVIVEDEHGYADFVAENTELHFPDVFINAQPYDSLSGRVDWWYDEDNTRVYSDALQVRSEQITAEVGFGFEFETPSDEARLGLDILISRGTSGQIEEYLPITLDKGLTDWLADTVEDTEVEDVRLLITTTMDPAKPVLDTVQIEGDLSGQSLVYEPTWPAVQDYHGHIVLDNHDLQVDLQGTTLGNPLEQISVRYPDIWLPETSSIDVSLTAQSTLERLNRYINSSPLKEDIGQAISDWTLKGRADLKGAFRLDLESGDASNLDFTVSPKDAFVSLESLPKIDSVTGDVRYTSDKELHWQNVKGRVLGGFVNSSLSSSNGAMELSLEGKADPDRLLEWQALPSDYNDYLSGKFNYVLDASIKDSGDITINAHSNLAGVRSSLPYPMNKPEAGSKMVMTFQAELLENEQFFDIDVGALNTNITKKVKGDDYSLEKAVVSFGRIPKTSRIPDKGVFVFGRLEQLDIKEWLFLAGSLPEGDGDESNVPIYADVQVASGSIGDLILDDLTMTCSPSREGHRIKLRSQQASGVIKLKTPDVISEELAKLVKDYRALDEDERGPLPEPEPGDVAEVEVVLDYLSLPEPEEDETAESDLPYDPLRDLDPSSVPGLDVKIAKLYFGTKGVGQWNASLRPVEKGMRLRIYDSHALSLTATGELLWLKVNDRHFTYLDVALMADDAGDVAKQLGYTPSIKTSKARVDVFSYWDGSPAAFNASKVQGTLDVSFEDGAFLNVSESANTLKVFGLLNFNSLGRRLKLDFSDVYQGGLAFDDVTARLTLNNGLLETDDPVSIVGPSASMHIEGATHLDKKDLDFLMQMEIPVSGALPLAVVVAGVNPVIGGLLLVGQNVWGGVVNQFTSLEYSISGSWDEPKLEAKRTALNSNNSASSTPAESNKPAK